MSISKSYHEKQIEKIDKLIQKSFWLKHKSYWFLNKWRSEHLKELKKVRRRISLTSVSTGPALKSKYKSKGNQER